MVVIVIFVDYGDCSPQLPHSLKVNLVDYEASVVASRFRVILVSYAYRVVPVVGCVPNARMASSVGMSNVAADMS